MRHQLAQVQRARSVVGYVAVHEAREHVVIAIAEYDTEIGRRAGRPDFDPADVNQMPGFRIGCEVEIEFPVPRPGKDVGDAPACQRPAFLIHQRFERAPGVISVGRGEETDFAVFRHVPALGAVTAAMP